MRLIDADALKKAFYNQECWSVVIGSIIDNAPTVEAVEFEYHSKLLKQAYQKGKDIRPQGEWIWSDNRWGLGDWLCNKCEHYAHDKSNFCPNCGARMGGNDNE